MENRIVITLQGEGVSLKSLGEVLSLIYRLLSELDKVVTSEKSLAWRLSGLSFGSAEVTVVPTQITPNSTDHSSECEFRRLRPPIPKESGQ